MEGLRIAKSLCIYSEKYRWILQKNGSNNAKTAHTVKNGTSEVTVLPTETNGQNDAAANGINQKVEDKKADTLKKVK